MNLWSLFGGPSHKPAPNVEGAFEKGPSVQFLSAALARPFEICCSSKERSPPGSVALGVEQGTSLERTPQEFDLKAWLCIPKPLAVI